MLVRMMCPDRKEAREPDSDIATAVRSMSGLDTLPRPTTAQAAPSAAQRIPNSCYHGSANACASYLIVTSRVLVMCCRARREKYV